MVANQELQAAVEVAEAKCLGLQRERADLESQRTALRSDLTKKWGTKDADGIAAKLATLDAKLSVMEDVCASAESERTIARTAAQKHEFEALRAELDNLNEPYNEAQRRYNRAVNEYQAALGRRDQAADYARSALGNLTNIDAHKTPQSNIDQRYEGRKTYRATLAELDRAVADMLAELRAAADALAELAYQIASRRRRCFVLANALHVAFDPDTQHLFQPDPE